jgi:hypothetical protein
MEKMDIMLRDKCVLCSNPIVETISIPNMSVYIAPTDLVANADFRIGECISCGLPQLTELIPLETLYANTHYSALGKMWDDHFEEFSQFVINNCGDASRFLEIGDPSYKTVSKCAKNGLAYEEWALVDPNCHDTCEEPRNCIRINEWFDPEVPPTCTADCIIASHLFEHFYDPAKCLQVFAEMTDRLILSIPNMAVNASDKRFPPIGMMFQHTFYLDSNVLKDMLELNGWNLDRLEYFRDNSIFVMATKKEKKEEKGEGRRKRRKKNEEETMIVRRTVPSSCIKEVMSAARTFIKKVLSATFISSKYRPLYIFGSHFGTQLMYALGLQHDKILGVLDNDIRKSGKLLPGTTLRIFTPQQAMETTHDILIAMFPYQAYWDEVIAGLYKTAQTNGTSLSLILPGFIEV